MSEFVLESALARANEALADRRNFALNMAEWKAFAAVLDARPRSLRRLRRLLTEPEFFASPRAPLNDSASAPRGVLGFPMGRGAPR